MVQKLHNSIIRLVRSLMKIPTVCTVRPSDWILRWPGSRFRSLCVSIWYVAFSVGGHKKEKQQDNVTFISVTIYSRTWNPWAPEDWGFPAVQSCPSEGWLPQWSSPGHGQSAKGVDYLPRGHQRGSWPCLWLWSWWPPGSCGPCAVSVPVVLWIRDAVWRAMLCCAMLAMLVFIQKFSYLICCAVLCCPTHTSVFLLDILT